MENNSIRHEIVSSNPDIDVRFYLSEDSGSYVAPHWHNSLELVYMIEGSMVTQFENNVRQTRRKDYGFQTGGSFLGQRQGKDHSRRHGRFPDRPGETAFHVCHRVPGCHAVQ